MKTSILLIFALFADARLLKKEISRDLEEKRSDDGGAASTRIIGGYTAEEDRYSYAVSLQTISHFCGGSLIAKDMVLSAAHCAGGSYDAIIGRHDHNDWDGDRIDVEEEYEHPAYTKTTNNYDVMLLKLARTTRANVTPVQLNKVDSTPSAFSSTTVLGWGITESGKTSDELKEVEVSVASRESCKRSYGSNLITDAMLCASDPGIADSCQGDSGGPLVVKGNSADTDLLVGIVSWGYGCGDVNYPGVYARVSSAYDWIREKVCEKSEDEDAKRRFQCFSSNPEGVTETTQTDTTGETDNGVDNGDDQLYIEDQDDDWWNSWTETVSIWWDSVWNP